MLQCSIKATQRIQAKTKVPEAKQLERGEGERGGWSSEPGVNGL